MKNREIEERLNRAIEDAPGDLKTMLMTTEVKKMKEHDAATMQEGKRVGNRWAAPRFAAVAASLVLVVFAGYFGYYMPFRAVDSVVYLDVNPSVSISTNRQDKVIELKALNDDAEDLLDDYKFNGKDLDTVSVELVARFVEMGYIDALNNTILITVKNGDEGKNLEQKERLSAAISDYLENQDIKPVLLSQSLTEEDDRDDAEKVYHISEGRLIFIESLLREDDDLDIQMLAGLSLDELMAIAQERDMDDIDDDRDDDAGDIDDDTEDSDDDSDDSDDDADDSDDDSDDSDDDADDIDDDGSDDDGDTDDIDDDTEDSDDDSDDDDDADDLDDDSDDGDDDAEDSSDDIDDDDDDDND